MLGGLIGTGGLPAVRPRAATATGGWTVAVVPAAALVAGVALVAAVLPAAGALEPRQLVHPPSVNLVQPSPLPRMAAWAREGDVELFRVRAARPTRLHLVALTEFTGASWQAAGTYRPMGGRADPAAEDVPLPPGRQQSTVDVEVTMAGLDGPWLPAPGMPAVGFVLLLGAARVTRRLRHRRAGIAGAWSEILDVLVLLGRPASPALPAPRVAAQLAELVYMGPGPHPALRLAELADRAAFGPETGRAPADVVHRSRRLACRIRVAARRGQPWRRRLVWPFDPRPLSRRSRTRAHGSEIEPCARVLDRRKVSV
ncbi:MAG TPA: hypothetical protein VFC00_16950 [Micromonosporaceae bacterium]|nr:hypothetical protein [Micromonosporaceae bacterium]